MSFSEVVDRLREGDEDAVKAFVQKYGPLIRIAIRRRLAGVALPATADSEDICQSALCSFLCRIGGGGFEFHDPRAMEALLLMIAQRKLAARWRYEQAKRRDNRRNIAWESRFDPMTSAASDPGTVASNKDLLDEIERRLNPPERAVFAMRRRGLDWNEIAEQTAMSSAAQRQRISRAVREIVADLGLDER